MRGPDRFRRMRELEKRLRPLTEKGWAVEDLTYEDHEGEPFRVYIRARLDTSDDENGRI